MNQTDLPELIWLLRRSSFIVSVDSGPMHIGAAITPELLSIHTWSDPGSVGPYNPDAWIWKAQAYLSGPVQPNRRIAGRQTTSVQTSLRSRDFVRDRLLH